MSATNMSGTIFIRENTLLPAGLAIESEVFLPGWRLVKNLNGFALARNVEGAKWNFFYVAGEIGATALGPDRSGTLRKAMKRILAKQEDEFNSLEITRVVSKRFLGIPFLSVATHSRHIQEGTYLAPAKDLVGIPASAPPETGPGSGWERHNREAITDRHTALISSS
jgi:hypothetical protein